jgi:hypothetical protein
MKDENVLRVPLSTCVLVYLSTEFDQEPFA